MDWLGRSHFTMRYIVALLLISVGLATALLLVGRGQRMATRTESRLLRAEQKLSEAKTEELRFYALGDAAKERFNAGKTNEARIAAEEVLSLAPKYVRDW